MARQVIERDRLGVLTKIGQGGQGVVYGAPNVKTKFAASMVYKEYKAQTLAAIDLSALAAMPALVEESLSYADGERLVSVAAWPCAIVEGGGTSTGFVMPAIPQEFFISLTTVKGESTSTAEFQHLLNHSSVLAARGITLDDAQRYSLLREVASGLAFLHKHGVCVGDISPKNLLFSLAPHEAVYFIDCDAMRINGVSALTQVETPGWTVPAGEDLATIYSDTYKLGLLGLRLLAGDHDTTNPGHLPSTTPGQLRQIITDTVTNQPHSRPLPEAWSYVLGHAIEEAQHRKKTAAPASAPLAAPEIPVLHSRPSGSSAPPVRPSAPPPSAPPPPPPAWAPPASAPASSTAAIWGAVATVAAVIVVAAVVIAVVLANHNTGTTSSALQTTSTESSGDSNQASAPAPTAPADPEADALQQLHQLADGDRSFVTAQLADHWVPQLSSKRPGIVDPETPGVVWNNQLTLQEHLRLRQQYNAKLIWSGDWPSANFAAPDYWVTIAAVTFDDSASALSWCTSQGLDADHCYGQLLSAGSTAHN
jgi:eukaryotic-like serine/threonine-protein kinase